MLSAGAPLLGPPMVGLVSSHLPSLPALPPSHLQTLALQLRPSGSRGSGAEPQVHLRVPTGPATMPAPVYFHPGSLPAGGSLQGLRGQGSVRGGGLADVGRGAVQPVSLRAHRG